MCIDYIEIRKTLSKKKGNVERYKYLNELYDSYQNDDKKEFLLWFEYEFLNSLNYEIRKYSKIFSGSNFIVNSYESNYEFYQSWLNEVKLKPIKSYSNTLISNPFRDNDSKDFFDYVVLNWDKKTANKWGYFWEFMVTKNNGKLTSKVDFENYLISHNLYLGKLNYDSCNSDKIFLKLEELLSQFKTK
jgi:hypothetical protein